MKLNGFSGLVVSVDEEFIAITGMWTLPIPIETAKEMLFESRTNIANDGLFPLPATSRTCLSVLNGTVAKIALTNSDIVNLRNILNK